MTKVASNVVTLLFCYLAASSCARMGNPDGGWFDDIPDFYKYLRRFHPTVEWVVCAK